MRTRASQMGLWPDATYDGNRTRHFNKPYYNSLQWHLRRGEAIGRAGFKCEQPGCRSWTGLEVHHLTYQHFGDEQPADLIVLCRDHHERASGL